MLYAVLVCALVGLDQGVKFLVRAQIQPGQVVEFLPHVLGLTYVRNTGAAFSMLDQHTWLLTLVSAVVSAVLVGALVKGVFRHRAGKVILAVILAGAVGNLIDRALFGFVTDMFQTLFMNFAVFNVADICVTCGGVAFCVYLLVFYDKLEKPHGTDSAQS